MDPLRFFKHKILKCECEIGEKSEETIGGSETNPKLDIWTKANANDCVLTANR